MQGVAMVGGFPKDLNVFKSAVFYPAIDKSLERSCPKGKRREPCYTAALTKNLAEVLNEKANKEAKRLGLPPKYRFGSCYVHQKPYVKFGPHFKLHRELGDLLVLVKRTINGTAVFNSTLFQLKKKHGKMCRISKGGGEDEQLTLYTNWGKLKIDLKYENATVYDVMPHAVSQGGLYMFIRLDQTPKFVVAVPDREMKIKPPSFGYYLSGMVEWLCGRAIASKDDVKQGYADDWSKLIWKVIDLLRDASCSCKGYGNVKRDNGCGNLAFLMGHPKIKSIGELENMNSDPGRTSGSNVAGFGVLYIEELEDSEHRSVRE